MYQGKAFDAAQPCSIHHPAGQIRWFALHAGRGVRHLRYTFPAMIVIMNTSYDRMSSRAAITLRASGNSGGACGRGPAGGDALSSATLQQVVAPMSVP
jgi:hypothetical protein